MEHKFNLPSARITFLKTVPNRNFITPNVISYFGNEVLAIELSEGHLYEDHLYSVSVVKNGELDYELSKCFLTLKEAYNYIEKL